ncbi:MAG: YebC/PmpR family DNA-binding transcriptional regulator [Candidatus Pelagibacter sp. TMED118]|nr:MAG: YebC/PmpR family DNA-binding transcriptional regulator [Candidatus Pelagibacter sp. TMED118]|tara:strand:+ start:853 stop:1575 length:723 start_codon:yes stop_codon:yes gene_type:complete
MAGHSHWAGIKHKKDRVDKIRSKIFSKLSREITIAAKLGDKDPDSNPRLRSAIQSAKSANMPKNNIQRALDKSKDSFNNNLENIRYEGFGPNNVAFIILAITDNKNRTAANIRTIFQKNDGCLGTSGSASHNFKQLGVIKFLKDQIQENIIYNFVVDIGVDDFLIYKKYYEVHCEKNKIYDIKKKLETKIKHFMSTEIEWIAINKVTLNKEQNQAILNLFENLYDNDDVQSVYFNLERKD